MCSRVSRPPPWDPRTAAAQEEEGSVKEHGIWGVILFALGVTCSTELRLSAQVWKFIRGTNSRLIVIPSGEQSVSPAECWRGDRLLQDDNWKESGWSSLAPAALCDSHIGTPACFGGGQITECYIWKNDYVLLCLIWQTKLLSGGCFCCLLPFMSVCLCACLFDCLLSDHCSRDKFFLVLFFLYSENSLF